MNDRMQFVDFDKYCNKCKYKDLKETEEPCDSCLTISVRFESNIPEYFKEVMEKWHTQS